MTDALSPAVFVDRDGTIIEDRDYCCNPVDVKIFPGVAEALERLKSKDFKLIVITNQSGIGRRLFTTEQYRAVEAEVLRQLGESLIDATYFCPHVPDQSCSCRKPAPGMVAEAARDHGIDLSRSFLVGDKDSDVECGRNAGVRTIRVKTGPQSDTTGSKADWVAADLPAAVEIILSASAKTARPSPVQRGVRGSRSLQANAHSRSNR
jgi:D-glycero-D-manno-heptose 1,7-bisphosphate phosphatase